MSFSSVQEMKVGSVLCYSDVILFVFVPFYDFCFVNNVDCVILKERSG